MCQLLMVTPKGLCLSPVILPFPLAVGELLVLFALEVPWTLPLLPLEKHPVCGASWSFWRSMGSESSSRGLCSCPISGWDPVLPRQPLRPVSPHRQKGRGAVGQGLRADTAHGRCYSLEVQTGKVCSWGPEELVLWEEVTQRGTGQRLSWLTCFLGHSVLVGLLSPMERQFVMGRG